MILNMPVNNGAMTSSDSQNPSELCEFLKRKYPESESNNNRTMTTTTDITNYKSNTITSTNCYKKRHIDIQNYELPVSSFFAKQHSPSSSSQETHQRAGEGSVTQIPISSESNVSSGTFNIIANSTAFINDLFTYDSNLLVPVATTSETSLCNSEPPIFTTPTTICVNSTNEYHEDNNESDWQATDLLELDHRYNSGIQTEITQLNPTVSLKPHEEESIATLNHNSQSPLGQQRRITTIKREHFIASPNATTNASDTIHQSVNQIIDSEADYEHNNLSWLLNFKFDEFPHLNPDVSGVNAALGKSLKSQQNAAHAANSGGGGGGGAGNYKTPQQCNGNGSAFGRERSKSPRNSNKTVKKFEELVMEVTSEMDGNDMVVAENVIIEDTSTLQRAPKKPPFTYTELIEYALEDKGELTVSGIYQWISDRFPYYKSNDDRWKNSVRHNLSINPHFRKGQKAPQGAGHLWTISSGDSAENVLAWEHKKQRLDLFFKMENMNRERLAQHHLQLKQQQQQQHQTLSKIHTSIDHQHSKHHRGCQHDNSLYDEAAVAAAIIQKEMMPSKMDNNHSHNAVSSNLETSQRQQRHSQQQPQHVLHNMPYNDLLTDEDLRKTAGQILNGIHREVEVQSLNHSVISTYEDVLLENDYLNPVHKDVAVNESGLRHSSTSTTSLSSSSQCSSSTTPYYVTEIDPMDLGIQMTSHPQSLTHTTTHNSSNNSHHHQHHHHQQQQQHHNNNHQNHQHNNHHLHHSHHHHHNQQLSIVNDHSPVITPDDNDVVLFNDEFNLNYFTYNSVTDIVA